MGGEGISLKKALVIVAGIWIIVFLLWGLNRMLDNNDSSDDYDYLNSTCYYYSQRLVKEKLKSPKSAEFPSYSDNFAKRSGDTVTITAYVDAQNSFGATIRTDYVATIKIKDGKPASGSVVLIE